jgi:site-specific recombinase XerC
MLGAIADNWSDWGALGDLKRDRAILAVLLGCGLRCRDLADLDFAHLQQREEYWAIVDLVGKGGHARLSMVW